MFCYSNTAKNYQHMNTTWLLSGNAGNSFEKLALEDCLHETLILDWIIKGRFVLKIMEYRRFITNA
jgi:hypothetical protein